ncbi:hypothetical protein [Flavobacterium caeni]|uniref:Uncharacterized protein n=1 Tax=Flavobacterium caeni TaxID=490189 RepID=A0A1G5KJA6_9FLAO|nr:hypothetical protein [Flavobacterium caeni]SCZ00321.1 hypothetical protein SAMN02927903_03325 [Flavobacterium caeni]
MKTIFETNSQFSKLFYLRAFLIILLSPPLVYFISLVRRRGNPLSESECIILVGILFLISIYVFFSDRIISKMQIDTETDKLLLTINYRFKKPSIMSFDIQNLQIEEETPSKRNTKIRTIKIRDGENSIEISSRLTGMSVEKIDELIKQLELHSP